MEQWDGWARSGARLFTRPNCFIDGYCMPYIFARQFGTAFRGTAMFGTDFDSLTSMWATQGPNYYLLGRLHVIPTAKVDDLLAEYYAGFAPAARQVKAYFDYWSGITNLIGQYRDELPWHGFAKNMHQFYTPQLFVEGSKLLARARQAAQGDPEATARVEFLQKGLEHARLCAETSRIVAAARESGDMLASAQAISRLDTYRKSIERDNIANLGLLQWIENRSDWGRDLVQQLGGRQIIGHLPIEWRMKWDPEEVGEARKWYDPSVDTSDWLSVRTDAAWEEQEVGKQWKAEHDIDYDGLAWYRVSFGVDTKFKGAELALIFGAVDEAATVWLNGELVGSHPYKKESDWYTPFTMEITDHVHIGEMNTLVVLVEDRAGLGGVWKPVMLVK